MGLAVCRELGSESKNRAPFPNIVGAGGDQNGGLSQVARPFPCCETGGDDKQITTNTAMDRPES
jgi:hypothetical protein